MPSPEALRFETEVISTFRARDQSGAEHTYAGYLALPPAARTGDEAAVVDNVFARSVFGWLGFSESVQATYNRTQGGARMNRPDFVVHAPVGTAFIWESKNTTEAWSEAEFASQLRRYVAGTAGYAVWCNARTLVALRFDPNGRASVLCEVPLESLFGPQPMLPELREEVLSALDLFHLLFRRERFAAFDALLANVCITKEEFDATGTPLSSEEAQRQFVNQSRQVLEHLKMAALARVRAGLDSRRRLERELTALETRWNETGATFLGQLPVQLSIGEAPSTPFGRAHDELKPLFQRMSMRLGDLEPTDFAEVEAVLRGHVAHIPTAVAASLKNWEAGANRVNTAASAVRFYAGGDPGIADALGVWAQKQLDATLATPDVFAEQAAYVFFVRVLLARVLEDKGLLEQRIVSNGGFDAWRQLVSYYAGEGPLNLHTQPFVYLLSARVSRYYQHFFQQPVFDWFIPDDLLLLETVEFLCRFRFAEVNADIIGFTYENYTNRVARNKKGHFLTQPRVVEYMLDLLGYAGADIIGRTLLDPACGSGSFLVHAATRYRAALAESPLYANRPLEQARQFIGALSSLFHGLEINPFSCYLAELNLLVAGLSELHALWKAGEATAIDRFLIFNTDSLDMPRPVLASTSTQDRTAQLPFSLEDALLDESYDLKARREQFRPGFGFVVSNPPYINAWMQSLAQDYSTYPFFAEALSGAQNTYLLFLRLGVHYLAMGGRMCFIVPLTVLGDGGASATRALLNKGGLRPTALVRFFTGNILFPGVDQATAVLVVEQNPQGNAIIVGGGKDVEDARLSEHIQQAEEVLSNTPLGNGWSAPWLVATQHQSYDIWARVMAAKQGHLKDLWNEVLLPREGDLRADHINPLRIGLGGGDVREGDVRIYKGENIFRFTPLPESPADWARPCAEDIRGQLGVANRELLRLRQLDGVEEGIALREIARLNTRSALTATWFKRSSERTFALTHEIWRFRLLPGASRRRAEALLGLFNSRPIAYLLNLFSTNNHVMQGELGRILIPSIATFPEAELAGLTEAMLGSRRTLEEDFVRALGARLPETGEPVSLAAARVLAQSGWPTISLLNYRQRGALTLPAGAARVEATLRGNRFTAQNSEVEAIIRAFVGEHGAANWNDLDGTQLPEPASASAFLALMETKRAAAQALWDEFVGLQADADECVADWYDFDPPMRAAIRQGLPWARRQGRGED